MKKWALALIQIDGIDFNGAIVVGDAGAKNAKMEDKVVIEMVRFPSFHSEGEGVIIDVLGPHGRPGVDTMLIMNQYGLESDFPDGVMDCARKQADLFDESISDGRVDLTEEMIITIDPKDARDFDDAISLKKIENGHWLLGVHIADVSHFVQPNTAIDDEGLQPRNKCFICRIALYLCCRKLFRTTLASLQPEKLRYAMSAFIEFYCRWCQGWHRSQTNCNKK